MIDKGPSIKGGSGAWMLLLLLAAGAATRYLYLPNPALDADMAMWGLLAMDILEGRPHFFFAGELFGGALEAWLAAPLFWLAGPSRLALCLVPTLFSLALVWVVWRLASREMDRMAALAATAWVALASWFLAWYGGLPLGAYVEVPFFTVVCFGLTLRLGNTSRLDRRPAAGWSALALGLTFGLGLWTHLLMLPAIASCTLYLLLTRPRLVFSRLALPAILGFLAGGLPLWLISLPAGLLDPGVLGDGRPLRLGLAWGQFWVEGLPLLLGLPGPQALGGSWPWWRLGVWCFYGIIALAGFWPRRTWEDQGPRRRGGLLALVWLYLLTYLVAWLFSGTYKTEVWRHLTPLYAGLPFVFGAGISSLGGRSRVLALVAACLALGLNLWGSLGQAPWLSREARLIYAERLQHKNDLLKWLREAGIKHAYGQNFWEALPLTLDAGGQPTFADQIENHLPRLTRQADADPRPAYVTRTRSTDFQDTLLAAGIAHARQDIGDFAVFHGFRQTWPALAEVGPRLWTSPQSGAGDSWDRDLATAWESPPGLRPGQALEVDLGAMEPDLCLVTILPGAFTDAAKGLEVAVSLDGQEWQAVASQPGHAFGPLFWSLDRPLVRFAPARQQLAFAPRPARFIRLSQTAGAANGWWSVAELFIHRAVDPARPSPGAAEMAQAAREVSPRGPIYAPPEVLALLPAEMAGFTDPQLPRRDTFPLNSLRLPLKPETVLCLPAANWPSSLELLRPHLAAPPQVAELGGHVLVSGMKALPSEDARTMDLPRAARLTSASQPNAAGLALDGSPATRWDTARNQEPGQELLLDLGLEARIGGLLLDAGPWPADRPRGLRVLVSADGENWSEPAGIRLEDGTLVWGGDRVLKGGRGLKISFAAQNLRQVRLVQTGHHPRRFWSVAELKLLAPSD